MPSHIKFNNVPGYDSHLNSNLINNMSPTFLDPDHFDIMQSLQVVLVMMRLMDRMIELETNASMIPRSYFIQSPNKLTNSIVQLVHLFDVENPVISLTLVGR